MTSRPTEQEYAPFYAGYVALVPEQDVLAALREQADVVRVLARAVPAERESFRYAHGKWTIRQVLGHLGDGERVFGYRAARFGRGDQTPLASFDENLYVANGRFETVALAALADEFLHLRAANLATLGRLDEAGWRAWGIASGSPVTVRALAYMMAGHVRHHLRILRERYGVGE
jgi:hypothetical protein